MNSMMISEHKLNMKNYSSSGKIKALIIPWIVYLVLLIVTRFVSVQKMLIHISESVQVNWVQSIINILINGLPWLSPIFIIFSIFTILRKQPFDCIRIYEDKIGFLMNGEERKVLHSQVLFRHGKMQKSVYIESKILGIKNYDYDWKDFNNWDVMKVNLERYANWDIFSYRRTE